MLKKLKDAWHPGVQISGQAGLQDLGIVSPIVEFVEHEFPEAMIADYRSILVGRGIGRKVKTKSWIA